MKLGELIKAFQIKIRTVETFLKPKTAFSKRIFFTIRTKRKKKSYRLYVKEELVFFLVRVHPLDGVDERWVCVKEVRPREDDGCSHDLRTLGDGKHPVADHVTQRLVLTKARVGWLRPITQTKDCWSRQIHMYFNIISVSSNTTFHRVLKENCAHIHMNILGASP